MDNNLVQLFLNYWLSDSNEASLSLIQALGNRVWTEARYVQNLEEYKEAKRCINVIIDSKLASVLYPQETLDRISKITYHKDQ